MSSISERHIGYDCPRSFILWLHPVQQEACLQGINIQVAVCWPKQAIHLFSSAGPSSADSLSEKNSLSLEVREM